MTISPNTFLCPRGRGHDHAASVVAKEESVTSGDIPVLQWTLPPPKAFKIPQSRRPRQS